MDFVQSLRSRNRSTSAAVMWTRSGSRAMTPARSVIVRTERPRARCHSTQFSIKSAVLSTRGAVERRSSRGPQVNDFAAVNLLHAVPGQVGCQAVQRERQYFTGINLWIRRLGVRITPCPQQDSNLRRTVSSVRAPLGGRCALGSRLSLIGLAVTPWVQGFQWIKW